jgi:hypothetical protein
MSSLLQLSKHWLLALLATVFTAASFAAPIGLAAKLGPIQLAAEFSRLYPTILVDARGSRGGNGDIAAAYLTVSDWLENYHLKSRITVLADENGRERLMKMSSSNAQFRERVEIREPSQGTIEEPFSLYLVLANPSGTYRYKKDFDSLFHFSVGATLLVQTVLGNTENQNSLHPFAIVENAGRVFDWGAAGLGSRESGVYTDFIAKRLRPMNKEQVKDLMLREMPTVTDDFSRRALTSVLDGSRLSGAKVGLVYGISANQTRGQFLSYLRGLATTSETARVLFTPSSFREADLAGDPLRGHVTFITSLDEMPAVAEQGRIYVIETKTLPHSVFTSLMAYAMKSGEVPVGAGDGFMSAAIELGGPFVLTQVPWNRANISRLREILLALAAKYGVASADMTLLKNLLLRNFDMSDFRTASALARFAPLFRLLKAELPSMSDRILEVALEAPHLKDHLHTPGVDDFILQKSVLMGGRELFL